MDSLEGFDERLELVLNRLGISNKRLSQLVEVTPATISSWLNNKKKPSLANIAKLSKALNVSLCWLMNSRGPMFLHGPIFLTEEEQSFIYLLRESPESKIDDLLDFIAKMSGLNDKEELIETTYAYRILENIGLPFLVLNENIEIETANEGFCQLLNINSEEFELIRQESFLDWLPPPLHGDFILSLKKARKSNYCQIANYELIQKGSKTALLVNMNIIPHSTKESFYYTIYFIPLPESPIFFP